MIYLSVKLIVAILLRNEIEYVQLRKKKGLPRINTSGFHNLSNLHRFLLFLANQISILHN